MSVFLLLHIHCVCYRSGDYRAERLFLSITVVLDVVQIRINISIYYPSLSREDPRQKPFWYMNTATMISCDRADENWEVTEVGKCGRLRRPKNFGG
jgi:hypothetical protein